MDAIRFMWTLVCADSGLSEQCQVYMDTVRKLIYVYKATVRIMCLCLCRHH